MTVNFIMVMFISTDIDLKSNIRTMLQNIICLSSGMLMHLNSNQSVTNPVLTVTFYTTTNIFRHIEINHPQQKTLLRCIFGIMPPFNHLLGLMASPCQSIISSF